MRLIVERWRERIRASLFFIPATFITVALLAIVATDYLDTRYADAMAQLPLLRTANAENTRQLLGTIAGATVTVAGIVFSVTVVAVQLTSSQFSPRVLHGFLRDRFDQITIGVVVATFVFCLTALATTPTGAGGQDPGLEVRHLTVTVAMMLGIGSILAIVAFIDHSARSLQVGHIIRSIADETRERVSALMPAADRGTDREEVGDLEPDEEGDTARSQHDGWIQQLDVDGVLGLVPEGGVGRVDVRVGAFVTTGTPVLTVWPRGEVDHDRLEHEVRERVVIGRTRTMQQDVAFGIRQLVDIALRALSPGINDPTTAYDVLANLGAILADVLQRDLPPVVRHGERGRVLLCPHDLDHEQYVGRAFDQIRLAGADKPAIGIAMLRVIGRLDELMRHRGLEDRREPLRQQAREVVATIERTRGLDPDTERVHAVADSLGLLADLGTPAAEDGPTSTESRADDDDDTHDDAT